MSQAIKKQRKINRFWFIWNLIESFVLLGGGVLAIVAGILTGQNNQGSPQGVENGIAYAVASFIILDGILRVVMCLVRYQKDDEQSPLVVAGFEISLGVLLMLLQSEYTDQSIFTYTVVNLIAIILMVMGALLMVYAIYVIARKFSTLFMPVVEILFAAILAGVGVVIEVLYRTQDSRNQLVLIMTGTILSLAAVGMFIITLITRAKAKKELDQAEREEEGNYQINDDKKAAPAEPKPAEVIDVIDADTVNPNEPNAGYADDSQKLSGPRAIEDHSKKRR